jgi:hypothetical protein
MFSEDKNAKEHLSSKEYPSGTHHKIKPIDTKVKTYFLAEIDVNQDFLSLQLESGNNLFPLSNHG